MSFGRLLILVSILLLLASPLHAKNYQSLPVDTQLLKKVARTTPGEDVIFVNSSITADLKYDETSIGFKGRFIIEQQIWLRTRDAVAQYGRVVVSSSKIRQLKDVYVEVKSLNGQKRKSFDQDDLEWVDHSRSSAGIIHLDTQKQHAAVPSLRVGDVLYVRQIMDVTGLHGLPVWTLGDKEIPVLHTTYNLTLPRNHELKFNLTGEQSCINRVNQSTSEKGKDKTFTWSLKWSADQSTSEVMVTPQVVAVEGMQPTGSFIVGETWEAVGRNYYQLITKRLEPNLEITALATGLVASCSTDSQRITVLYEYLQENTRYLGFYEGLDGILPETASSVHERGYGDCKGLASYLIALLLAVDIEARPVLVRTASLGPLDETLPNMTQFNHAIVWADVGEQGMWLDAVVDHCPAGMIVSQDTASKVLLLRDENAGLMTIAEETSLSGVLSYSVEGELKADCGLEVTITMGATGMAAIRQRHFSEQGAGDLARSIEKTLMPHSMGARIVEFSASEVAGLPLWTSLIQGTAPLPHTTESVFLPATLPPLPRLKNIEDVAKEINRREQWSLVLPAGWKVKEDDQTFDGGSVSWNRKVWNEDGRLRLERNITWHPDKEEKIDLKEALREIATRESGFFTISIQ